MSRNRRHRPEPRHSLPKARRVGGSYSPPTPFLYKPPRLPAFALEPVPYLRTRASALDHPVFAPRTVRRPLIRTVLRDTTRRVYVSHRPSVAPVRAAGRMRAVTGFPNFSLTMPRTAIEAPLQRALSCAKRSIRREVLFALRSTNGRGSAGVPKSKVRC